MKFLIHFWMGWENVNFLTLFILQFNLKGYTYCITIDLNKVNIIYSIVSRWRGRKRDMRKKDFHISQKYVQTLVCLAWLAAFFCNKCLQKKSKINESFFSQRKWKWKQFCSVFISNYFFNTDFIGLQSLTWWYINWSILFMENLRKVKKNSYILQ